MGSISPFSGARGRRDARRDKRSDNRKLRKKGPEKQYYGGSEDALKSQRDRADASVDKSQGKYDAATDKLSDTADLAADREASSARDYNTAKGNTGLSRSQFNSSIDGIGTAGQSAIAQRNTALQANDLNKIADANILQNNRNAQNVLGRNIGLQNRAAMGLATGGGEGGALALQSAIAAAGQGGADMAGASQLQQNQLATDTRNAAAQAQVANALGTANLNAGTTTDAANATAAATGQLLTADQAQQQAITGRQLNFMGQALSGTQAGAGAALENQGQMLNNNQTVNGTQLGVDMTAAKNRFDAAQANNPFKKALSTLFDPADLRGSGTKGLVS